MLQTLYLGTRVVESLPLAPFRTVTPVACLPAAVRHDVSHKSVYSAVHLLTFDEPPLRRDLSNDTVDLWLRRVTTHLKLAMNEPLVALHVILFSVDATFQIHWSIWWRQFAYLLNSEFAESLPPLNYNI